MAQAFADGAFADESDDEEGSGSSSLAAALADAQEELSSPPVADAQEELSSLPAVSPGLQQQMEALHATLGDHLDAEPGQGHPELRELRQDETDDLHALYRILHSILRRSAARALCYPLHCSLPQTSRRSLYRRAPCTPAEAQLSPQLRGGNEPSLVEQIRGVVLTLYEKVVF